MRDRDIQKLFREMVAGRMEDKRIRLENGIIETARRLSAEYYKTDEILEKYPQIANVFYKRLAVHVVWSEGVSVVYIKNGEGVILPLEVRVDLIEHPLASELREKARELKRFEIRMIKLEQSFYCKLKPKTQREVDMDGIKKLIEEVLL